MWFSNCGMSLLNVAPLLPDSDERLFRGQAVSFADTADTEGFWEHQISAAWFCSSVRVSCPS